VFDLPTGRAPLPGRNGCPGSPRRSGAWFDGAGRGARFVAVPLDGTAIDEPAPRCETIEDDLLQLMNAHRAPAVTPPG